MSVIAVEDRSGAGGPFDPQSENDAASKPAGDVVHRLPDVATGKGMRSAVTLPAVSRCPTLPWWKRVDPYWNDGLFDSHLPWSTMFKADAMFKKSGSSIVYADAADQPGTGSGGALRLPDDEDDLECLRRAVSVLFGCGVVTTGHLQSLTGADPSFIRGPLLGSGLVEYTWHHFPGRPYPRVQMWRLRNHSDQWRQFAAECAREEGMAAAMFPACHPLAPLGPGRAHSRHQTLAVELALRAMEIGDRWVGWLPEAFCTPQAFCPSDHKARDRTKSNMRADACLVRIDGVRVFIEVQANTSGNSVKEKVLRWGRLLDEGPFSGVVLFVASGRDLLGSVVAQAIKEAIREHASGTAAKSMLVGWWPDYSPDLGQATEAAGTLRAGRWTGEAWQAVTADETPAERADGDWHLLTALSSLASSPAWVAQ